MSARPRFLTLAMAAGSALLCVDAPAVAQDREDFASAYICEAFTREGKSFDKFTIAIQEHLNGDFEYEVEISSDKVRA